MNIFSLRSPGAHHGIISIMNTPQKSYSAGFTVIELIVAVIILVAAGVLIFMQINNLTTAQHDKERKTAINAMYFALEEVYYQQNKSYPEILTTETLPSVDPKLFTDPDGFTLGKDALSVEELQKLADSGDASDDVMKRLNAINAGKEPNYHYDATDCDASGKCKSYKLRANMQTEAEYVKKSRNS